MILQIEYFCLKETNIFNRHDHVYLGASIEAATKLAVPSNVSSCSTIPNKDATSQSEHAVSVAITDNTAPDDDMSHHPSLGASSSPVLNSVATEDPEPASAQLPIDADNSNAEQSMPTKDSSYSTTPSSSKAASDSASSVACGTFYGSRRVAKKPVRYQ